MPSKVTKVSTTPENSSGDNLEMAKAYRHYFNQSTVADNDRVPEWMDAVLEAPKKRVDAGKFEGIWP